MAYFNQPLHTTNPFHCVPHSHGSVQFLDKMRDFVLINEFNWMMFVLRGFTCLVILKTYEMVSG